MQLIIDIPEEEYKWIKKSDKTVFADVASKECMLNAIKNGTPLPKGHGELKDINAIKQKLMIWDYKVNAIPNYAWKCIEDAPIIIEADKEDSDD